MKTTLEALLCDPDRGRAIAESLASTYGIALVDECQDTDEAQLSVFDAVFSRAGKPLLFIGDPKQAIYRFRGADVHAYLAARDRADGLYTMDRNFRSTPKIVDTLDALYRETPHPFGAIDIDFPRVAAAKTSLAQLHDPGSKGAVEVLKPGRVWFAKDIEGAERQELACLYVGLMLYMPPDATD